jgi:hypothetical protein
MPYTKKSVYYFDKPGPENTKDTIEIALERAKELGITTIVVASTQGNTGLLCTKAGVDAGIRVITVSHAVGFKGPGISELPDSVRQDIITAGGTVVTATHALSGVERACSNSPKIGGGSRTDAIAETLRRTIGIGVKVCVECVLMTADAGLLPMEKEVIAIAGTATGADTICVIHPSHTNTFFDLQVREIVAAPRKRDPMPKS